MIMKKLTTKTLVVIGMLTAISFILVAAFRIPVVQFLKYEPKDIIIAVGGFIYGPFCALFMSVAVALIEMVTISSEGIIGFVMNFLSSAAFALPAAVIYKKHKTAKGAAVGLSLGAFCMCATMVLWNYLITPLYLKVPREMVAAMIPTVFLPFNLLKSVLNAALTMLLYKHIVRVLRGAKLVPQRQPQLNDGAAAVPGRRTSLITTFSALAVIIICVVILILWKTVWQQ